MIELIEMPFGLRTQVGPGNHVLHGSPDPPWERAVLTGESGHLCKNGRTDAIWVMGWMGPKQICVRWGFRFPMRRGNFGGTVRPQ